MKYEIQINGAKRTVEVNTNGAGPFRVQLDGQPASADAVETAPNTYSILLDGHAFEARVSDDGSDEGLLVRCAGADFRVQVSDPRSWRGRRHSMLEAAGPQRVLASMPGKVVRVLVAEGQAVRTQEALVIIA